MHKMSFDVGGGNESQPRRTGPWLLILLFVLAMCAAWVLEPVLTKML